MGDGTKWRTTCRIFGPPSPCSCDRFFVGEFDSPRFWSFTFDTPQTHVQWLWLNDFHWCESVDPQSVVCDWSIKYNELIATKNLVIELFDNPDYTPGSGLNPFRLLFRAVSVSVNFTSQWLKYFDVGGSFPIFRDASYFFASGDWVGDGNNTPNAVRPLGRFDVRTEQCQPGWSLGHPPT